jgi:competence protein ComEC
MAAAVFSGFGVFLLGDIAPPLALLCGWLCSVSLAAMESCLAASLQLPYGYLWVPSVPAWWVAAFYTAFGVWLTGRGPARVPLWCLTFSGVWLAFGGLLAFNPELRRDSARDALQITFASLGHGTSVLIELPDGRKLLYDAGHQGTPQSAAGPISALLWSRGIWRLDAVILSHADIDHYNAVPQLLDRFRVDHLFVTPSLLQGEGAAIRALRDAVTAARLPVTELAAPACLWRSGTDELRVLHPPPRGVAGSDNANSLVLFVDFRGSHVLLPGDLEAPGLQHLLASRSFDCDVAMAPHHGSGRSEPEAFAAWAQPEWVIISGGTWRDTSAAARSFGRRGARVFHTAYDGAIRVRCQDGDLYVQSWRHAAW